MQEKVVRLQASSCPDQIAGRDANTAVVVDYVIDMIGQLARIAHDHGEPLLGAMLEEVLQRQGPLRTNTGPGQSRGKSPG